MLSEAKSNYLSRIRLQKYLFLLSKTSEVPQACSFYDFIPYKYGPYSFLAHHEINRMLRDGIIEADTRGYRLRQGAINRIAGELDSYIKTEASTILRKYTRLSLNQLIDSVYGEFPWYAHRNEQRDVQKPVYQHFKKSIFTIGYENLSIDTFLNILLSGRIKAVIDVRRVPYSRKFGFSKQELFSKCKSVGIQYVGFPAFGIESNIRNSGRNRDEILRSYQKDLSTISSSQFNNIESLIKRKRAVLVCYEQEPLMCHRYYLAQCLSSNLDYPIVHYNTGLSKWEKESNC